PYPVAQNVIYYGANLSASFSASENGVLAYQADFPNAQLKWYDRHGSEAGEIGQPAKHWGNVRLSRDRKHVLAGVWNAESGSTGAWTFDPAGRESRRLSLPPEIQRRPVFSADGTRVAMGRSRITGSPKLATMDLAPNSAPREFEPLREHVNAVP